MATKTEIEWPDNLNVQGLLSFPIKSAYEIGQLIEWRKKKNIKKPKFPDKVGASLLLKQGQHDKAVEHLLEMYVPFIDTLYRETDGEKGFEPNEVKRLLRLVKAQDWSESNLPIRDLTDKDVENNGGEDCPYVSKISFKGPYEGDLHVKSIVRVNGTPKVMTLDDMGENGYELPDGMSDTTKLWWGARWNFRVNLRLNAFDSPRGTGVTAYGRTLYLLPELGLPVLSGNGADNAVIAEDGDDWEE